MRPECGRTPRPGRRPALLAERHRAQEQLGDPQAGAAEQLVPHQRSPGRRQQLQRGPRVTRWEVNVLKSAAPRPYLLLVIVWFLALPGFPRACGIPCEIAGSCSSGPARRVALTPPGDPWKDDEDVFTAVARGRIVHPGSAGIPLTTRPDFVQVPIRDLPPLPVGLIWRTVRQNARIRALAATARFLASRPT
jgi:hypothetical protein